MSMRGSIGARLIRELTPASSTTSGVRGMHRPQATRAHRFQPFLPEVIARQGRRDCGPAIRTPLL
jgi:hypothetical protein